jgi:hypothetical protein
MIDTFKTDLLGVLEVPERWAQSQKEDDMALAHIRDLHAKLEGLVGEMDDIESGFDQRAELSRMSGKRFLLWLDGRSPVVLSSSRLALLARHGGWVSTCRECITLTVLRLPRPSRTRSKRAGQLLARR